jgi:glycerol-3-phosphate acyltransferase PlsY
MELVLVAAVAYLLGSIPFAVVVSRLMGLADPRTYGSRNPGATNVLRSGSRVAALLTLAGDAAKGWVAVWLTTLYTGAPALAGTEAPLAGLAALVGHVYPIYLRFRGGKGVATAAGVLFGLNLWLGAGTLATFAVIAAFFRYVSLASLIAALFAPLYAWWLFGLAPALWFVAAMALLLIWRHRENLARLAAGTEARLGQRTPS